MMKNILWGSALCSFLLVAACTDGTKTQQRIEAIIKERNIETITVTAVAGSGQSTEFNAEDITIDDQFLRSGDEYLNLGLVKTFKVSGTRLELTF